MEKISDRIMSWLPQSSIEPEAMQQIRNISEMPFLYKHVAVMPDCHLGRGATVGSVIATEKAIIPAAVGVDIGCGMVAVKTTIFAKDLPDDLAKIRHSIERSVPASAGRANENITASAKVRILKLESLAMSKDYNKVAGWWKQLGSLGGGNHFIELSLDTEDRLWIVLHSGSRGIGNKLATLHIKKAQEICDRMFVALKDRDLAYLPEETPEFKEYIRDLLWAQEFAKLNRDEMMDRVLKDVSYWIYGEDGHQQAFEVERVNCHHNFTQMENHMGRNVWITRKGAIQMQDGQLGVIPGSMGTRSYIVAGKGNVPSFHSAPHGAGRRFSRAEARKRFTLADFETQMKGIECRREECLVDELPGAYKDIDEVMENAKELVDVKHVLRQIVNVKGD